MPEESRLEIKELIKIGRSCVHFNLRKTTRKISSFYDEVLKPSGLRATQLSILVTIATGKAKNISNLASLVEIDRTTLQRSLKILERDELILNENKVKGNVKSITITESGKEKLKKAIDLWNTAQEKIISEISHEKINLLFEILSDVRNVKV